MTGEQGITVTGSGRAAAVPDVFVARLMAQASSSVPAEAMERALAAIARMRGAAVERGAEPTTGNLGLRQGFDREGRPAGVVAELVLSLRSGDAAGGGELLAACVTAGGDEARLESSGFEHSAPASLLVAARESAFRDAHGRARQLASLAGRDLGSVREVVEGASAWTPVAVPLAMKSRASFDTGPLDPGQLDAEVTVTVTWDWRQA